MMRRIGCGDDDQVDGPREQVVDATKEFDIRIARVRRAPATALDDGGEAETFHGANDGCVEYLACKAEPDESNGEHDRRLYRESGASLWLSVCKAHSPLELVLTPWPPLPSGDGAG